MKCLTPFVWALLLKTLYKSNWKKTTSNRQLTIHFSIEVGIRIVSSEHDFSAHKQIIRSQKTTWQHVLYNAKQLLGILLFCEQSNYGKSDIQHSLYKKLEQCLQPGVCIMPGVHKDILGGSWKLVMWYIKLKKNHDKNVFSLFYM
jgi:hypothetical protein